MKRLLLIAGIVASALLVSSCQSQATIDQLSSSHAQTASCRTQAINYVTAMRGKTPTFSDSRDLIIYTMLMNQNKDQAFSSCDDFEISLLNYHERRFGKLTGLGRTGLNVTGGLIGLGILSGAVTDLANDGGSSSYSITNSRVVQGSTGSSASGAGDLIDLSNVGGRDAAGGLAPRQLNSSPNASNSGEGQDGGLSPEPEPLPEP